MQLWGLLSEDPNSNQMSALEYMMVRPLSPPVTTRAIRIQDLKLSTFLSSKSFIYIYGKIIMRQLNCTEQELSNMGSGLGVYFSYTDAYNALTIMYCIELN